MPLDFGKYRDLFDLTTLALTDTSLAALGLGLGEPKPPNANAIKLH